MSSTFLIVIAKPGAPSLTELGRLPKSLRVLVSEDPEQLKAQAPEADAVLYAHGSPDLLTEVLRQAKRLRWVHSLWTGVESILTPELRNHPAALTNGRGVFRWPLADWVVGVMLSFAFDFRRIISQQEQAEWKPFVGSTLHGRTLGIVGYGSIGSAIAERARPFGMKIAALRRRQELSAGDPQVDVSYAKTQLKDLMASSDYVVAVTPLTEETKGMIGATEIDAMKPTAIFINIGRGPVVDEGALVRALQAGRIRGAALDVFSTEPLPREHPFWKMSNVLLSPHTADRIEGFLEPAFECFFENLARFERGEALTNEVDKNAGY